MQLRPDGGQPGACKNRATRSQDPVSQYFLLYVTFHFFDILASRLRAMAGEHSGLSSCSSRKLPARSTDSEYLGTVATEMTSLAAANNVFEGENTSLPSSVLTQYLINHQSKTVGIQRQGMQPSLVLWRLRKEKTKRRMSWVQSLPSTSCLGRVKSLEGWSISHQRRWRWISRFVIYFILSDPSWWLGRSQCAAVWGEHC